MIKFKNMITEDYVSFEVAKLLKEKGFVIPYDSFRGVYINGIFKRLNPGDGYGCNLEDEIVDVCSLQLAMKWLREVHDLHIIAYPWKADREERASHWCCKIYKSFNHLGYEKYTDETPKSYEEACETAIRYSLKNLI